MLRVSDQVVDYKNFTLGKKAGDVGQKHAVMQAVMNDTGTRVFMKHEKEIDVAQKEVNIQEIQRLLYSPNPVTMLVVDHDKQRMFVASEEVNKFTPLRALIDAEGRGEIARRINAGVYTGLGNIMVLALLAGEADLHMNNIGVRPDGRFVRIDGDWAQARVRFGDEDWQYKFNITERLLAALPKLETEDFMPYNYFDQVRAANISNDAKFLDTLNPVILRQEINEQLLKCLLAPDAVFVDIINHHAVADRDDDKTSLTVYMELANARAQLFKAACLNPSFREFMQSPAANNVAQAFKEEVAQFRLAHSNLAVTDVAVAIDERFSAVQRLQKATDEKEFMKLYATSDDISKKMLYNSDKESSFMIAVKSNDTALAKAIYRKVRADDKFAASAAVDQPDKFGYTPVMMAAKVGNKSLFNYLREDKKADMHAVADNGYNVLLVAAAAGNLYAVRKSRKVVDINSVSNGGTNALIMAVRDGHRDVVEYLLKKKIKDVVDGRGKSALVHAVENGYRDIAELLLENKTPSLQLNMALIAAAQRNDEDLALKILAKCDQVYGINADHQTALMLAASNGMSKLVAAMIPKMSVETINYQHDKGRTALMEAANSSDNDSVRAIAAQPGVKLLATDKDGGTAVSLLADNENYDLALELLTNAKKRNALVHVAKQETLMHYAAKNGDLDAVVKMAAAGISLTSKNHEGKTPFHYAVVGGNDTVIFFLEQKCNPFRQDSEGVSPFQIAAAAPESTIIQTMLARCKPPAEELIAALEVAVHFGKKDVVGLLMSHGVDVEKAGLVKEVEALFKPEADALADSNHNLTASNESLVLSNSNNSFASASTTDQDPTDKSGSALLKERSTKSGSGNFGLFGKTGKENGEHQDKTAEFRSKSNSK